MIYLILAILCSLIISIIMRISETHVKNEMGMFMSNYAICIALALSFIEDKTELIALSNSAGTLTLILGIISGILYLGNFVLLKFNMACNGIVMASTFMKLGIIVPTIMAVVVFHEVPKWSQVAGLIIAIVAILLINLEKDSFSESKKKIWLLILLIMSGITESMTNIFDKIGNASHKDLYLLLTFGTAFLCAVLLAIKEGRIYPKDCLFGICIGVPNYFFSRFILSALESIDAVVVYPTYSVAAIVATAIVGVVVFHESISKKKMCALGLILVALVFLNI